MRAAWCSFEMCFALVVQGEASKLEERSEQRGACIAIDGAASDREAKPALRRDANDAPL